MCIPTPTTLARSHARYCRASRWAKTPLPTRSKLAPRAPTRSAPLLIATSKLKREEIDAGEFRQSSYEVTELYLKRGYHCKPLHDMNIDKITLKDVAAVLETAKKKSGPTTALRVRSNLSSLFAYAIGMGLREDNPVINTLKAAVPNGGKRDRVLSEEEIAAIWQNLPEDHDFGRIIKLLILTGCREDEIG